MIFMKKKFTFSRITIALALCSGVASLHAQTATEVELMRRLDQLASELNKVKAELNELQQSRNPPAASPAVTPPQAPAAASSPTPNAITAAAEPSTVISGYAELNYNRPTRQSQNAQADMRRFVLGYQHRFDDKTKVVTELEVEHGVSSASDRGEVEVEQAYLERQISPNWSVRAGLFLMPMGLLNENHEPPSFLGVERNFVETAIIPSTWREGGVQAVGSFDNGITVQGGIVTSFDLNKWDATSSEGRESPLGSIHQELSQARARDLAVFGAVNWRGIPGLQLGGSIFSGQATHKQANGDARITLWDVHARWTPGRWDLSTVYSRGSISNTATLNAPLVGSAALIPSRFDGWYAQAGYKLWEHDSYRLVPFVRWEQFNTARSFADIAPGLTPAATPTERVFTLGANFQVTPGVVVKADVQRFRESRDNDRINLGLGWSF